MAPVLPLVYPAGVATCIAPHGDRALKFAKYHGLGNDYLVIEGSELELDRALALAPRICHRNYGVGSDGILLGPVSSQVAQFGLRIINPDGSQAEKSGNGLRIFARFLWDTRRVSEAPFTIETPGGVCEAHVRPEDGLVVVGMGTASFDSAKIGVTGPRRELVGAELPEGNGDREGLRYTAVTVGNPHCVVTGAPVTEAEARRLGPRIENDPRFTHRTNVQLLRVVSRTSIEIQIWERGAGYTLASGSSASAAACAARRLGLCDENIVVSMPGGTLQVTVTDGFEVTQKGPAERIAHGWLSEQALGDATRWQPLP